MQANITHWVRAFRLRTLPLALSSIAMAGFLAAAVNAFRWSVFILCILTTIFLQILSNLANDYGDSIHGADSAHRQGPLRTVQSGAISASSMKRAIIFFATLSFVCGMTLLFTAFGSNWRGILFFLVVGIMSIAAAIAYTVGKKPYGYAGLGDISVFIFFGLVGVLGSYYLFTQTLDELVILPAITCGLFSVAVLNINNIRDIESDLLAGKYSVPVRIGRKNAVIYHWIIITGGITAACVYTFRNFQSPWQLLFLLSVPLLIANMVAVTKKKPSGLDPYLRQMALATLAFVLLFGTGLLLASR